MVTTKKTDKRKFSARHVVKRGGHTEPFDERKIYASVYEACHGALIPTTKAEKIASSVSNAIKKKVEQHETVSAHAIKLEVVKELKKHHKDVAFLYETHKELC